MKIVARAARAIARYFDPAMLLALVLALAPLSSLANQSNTWSPTTGTVSGLQLTTNYNNAFSALQSCNSGTTAPTNDQTASPVTGQCWLDTSVTPNIAKQYDGTSWVVLGFLDTVNHQWLPVVGGGAASVASATSTSLCSVDQSSLTITGTTTITGFGTACQTGQMKVLTFSGTLTLTHSSSLFLPNNGNNITTAANDRAFAVYQGGSNWIVVHYTTANGTALNASSNFSAAVNFQGVISPTALASGSTNNWAPTGLSTANTIRATPNSSSGSTITGLTAGAAGQVLVLQNIGVQNLTLTAQDTNSSAGNRFLMPMPVRVAPNQHMLLVYDNTSAGWRPEGANLFLQPTGASFANLKIVNDSGAPTTTMDITADQLVVADAFGYTIRFAGGVSVAPVLTSSGANGLDTGTIQPNTWYSVNVIYNPTTNTPAGLYSVQSNCLSATLPSGYTACMRVGWVRTDATASPSSRFLRTLQFNRRVQYVVTGSTNTASLPIIANGPAGTFSLTTPTWSVQSVASVVPPTASRIVMVMDCFYNGAGSGASVQIAPSNQYGGSNSANPSPFSFASTTGPAESLTLEMALEATTIAWAANASGGAIFGFGWEDNL